VRKLLVRIGQEGDRGVVHRLRGRVSNRRLAEKVRRKALKLVEAKYRDFGPTLACEYLAKHDEVKVSKETLRQWLIAAGLRRVRRRKAEEVHVWRPRRSCRGELVQWDTSEHDWLEGRGPKLYLVAMIDDADSQAYARCGRCIPAPARCDRRAGRADQLFVPQRHLHRVAAQPMAHSAGLFRLND
jgi:hypothetical protein